jgi:hypothetical protein
MGARRPEPAGIEGTMNIDKMIAQLRAEMATMQQALAILENLSRGSGGGKGKSGSRKRKPFSAETKRKMAESQRKRWAAYRKGKK